MISVFDVASDAVIKSAVAMASTDYRFALENFFPLLDRFGEQRKLQSKKFYSRLRKDIIAGCVMPPITIAFVDCKMSSTQSLDDVVAYVNKNIMNGYVLDGMQRINTLKDASSDEKFDYTRKMFLNIIIAERYDLLLYRMITLNNGQKPMTARHQVEMLTKGVVDISGLSISIASEKETEGTKIHGAFKLSDVVESYTAFLTDSVNNQNSKIIESKLDEIIVGKVLDSNIAESSVSFSDVLMQIDRMSINQSVRDWFRQVNNMIGFTVGAKHSIEYLEFISPDQFSGCIKKFEDSFSAINPSKINVGKYRRELVSIYIDKLNEFFQMDVSDIQEKFFEMTMTE